MKKIIVMTSIISLLSLVEARADYKIYPQISAQILWIAGPEQTFKKGEILVRLDNKIAKTKLEKAQALLKISQQLLADAKLTYEQTKQLFDNLVRSKRELELAEIAYKQAQQKFYAQQAQVKQQQLILDKHQIKAPFNLKVVKLIAPRNVTNHHHPQPLLLVQRTDN